MQDAVVKVDRKTGQVVWILGDHAGWKESLQPKLLTPVGEMSLVLPPTHAAAYPTGDARTV